MSSSEKKHLDPADAMAVDATPDSVRLHGDGDETDAVERSDGAHVPVDEEQLEADAED